MDPSMLPFLIIAIVASASTAVELLSWLFVYRTANYKRIVSEIEAVGKKFAIINSGPQVRMLHACMHGLWRPDGSMA